MKSVAKISPRSCWNHRSWDQVDAMYKSGMNILKLGLKEFEYVCPDCGSTRRAFFSDSAVRNYIEMELQIKESNQ